ncbi:MAG: rRNA maturation RNase YbeY [SAR202 cluster bacterium]|nr:rRNA maturation RNase YbeY [SAR202 cluster bacterium]
MTASPDNDGQVTIQVFGEFVDMVSAPWMNHVARCTLSVEASSPDEFLSIVITDDQTVRSLNKLHRGLDEHTDVLSFSFRHQGQYYGEENPQESRSLDGEFVLPPGESTGLGEVIISFPQAERQARDAGRSVRDELDSLLAHGILHLLGYDHMKPTEEAEMKVMEANILVRAVQDD